MLQAHAAGQRKQVALRQGSRESQVAKGRQFLENQYHSQLHSIILIHIAMIHRINLVGSISSTLADSQVTRRESVLQA